MLQCVAVVGIFPLRRVLHKALSQTGMTVNGCEEQQTADGQRGTHGTSVHLVCSDSPAIAHPLQRDLCLQWGATAMGSLSAADLKRQNTTPLQEVNRCCSFPLQTKGS